MNCWIPIQIQLDPDGYTHSACGIAQRKGTHSQAGCTPAKDSTMVSHMTWTTEVGRMRLIMPDLLLPSQNNDVDFSGGVTVVW